MRHVIALSFVLAAVVAAVVAAEQATPPRPSGSATPGSNATRPSPDSPRASAAAAATGDPGTGAIRGRVTRADTDRPLAGVRVSLNARDSRDRPASEIQASVFTDGDGRYELTGLRAGRYTAHAFKAGFVGLWFGQRGATEPAMPIDVTASQTASRIDFALPKGGVIAGMVVDDVGQPLTGVHVGVLQQRWVNGQRNWVPVGPAAGLGGVVGTSTADVTDDLGQFRLHGLLPGTYYLAAQRPSGEASTTRPTVGVLDSAATLYPGTLSEANALPITLAAGDELMGLSFPVLPVPRAAIRGVLRTADGQGGRRTVLLRTDAALRPPPSRSMETAADGSFAITGLPPARYVLGAVDGNMVATARVALDGTDAVVSMVMTQGATLSGRVVLDTGEPVSTLARTPTITANAGPLRLQAVGVPPNQDGTFTITGLAGQQRMVVSNIPGWTVMSVQRNGIDVGDAPFDFSAGSVGGVEITLTQKITAVTGRVSDPRGQATSQAAVIVFHEDEARWGPGSRSIKVARPDQGGRFTLQDLPPGRYIAVAVEHLERGEEFDPDVLERLSTAGRRLRLEPGETQALDLRVVAP